MSIMECIFIGVFHTVLTHLIVWAFIPLEIVYRTDSIYNTYDYGLAFVNPFFIYKKVKVNWFGAFVLAFVNSLICPTGTIGYWFYKLCIVGRKD